MAESIHLAANNPDLGGGEQMLVRVAAALVALGREVSVVAPDFPAEVLDAAAAAGAATVAIRADGRRAYARRLRAWDRSERRGLLWCHGLVPALATAGHRRRVIHLHQLPRSRAQRTALAIARAGSDRLLVPSGYLAGNLRGAKVCANWTDEVDRRAMDRAAHRVGFLGRLSTIKGIDVLAQAIASESVRGDVQLVVAGDDRWVADDESGPVLAALDGLGDRVRRLGRVSPETFFEQVDLAAFPSRIAESFGLVVAEAMAAGVPFIISDAGALPEVAGPDHPWVVRAGDVDALARVIGQALAATPEQLDDMTDRARRRWESEFSPAAGRERVRRLLDDLGVT